MNCHGCSEGYTCLLECVCVCIYIILSVEMGEVYIGMANNIYLIFFFFRTLKYKENNMIIRKNKH